ncbi:MAG: hypothetical protein AB4426_22730 [Xenococcaceae cyanobacterium]
MAKKFQFYQGYGVEEYYLYDPDLNVLKGWLRRGERLEVIEKMAGWISPRLKIRFEVCEGTLQLYKPNGERFETFVEIVQQRERERQEKERERQRAEQAEAALEEERRQRQVLLDRLRERGIDLDRL